MSRGIGYSLEGLVLREETKKGRTARVGILFSISFTGTALPLYLCARNGRSFDATLKGGVLKVFTDMGRLALVTGAVG